MNYEHSQFMHHYPMGAGPFDLFWHVLLLAFIIWVLVRMIRSPRRGHHGSWQSAWHANSALSLLDERYAKGEIEKEEYEERKKTLQG